MNLNPFNQPPPELGNQYEDDRVLRHYLQQQLPADLLAEIEPSLQTMGELSGGELYQLQLADRLNEPRLTQWDAWGNRIDQIELTPLWEKAERLAAEHGVVATAYDGRNGRYNRLHQFALAYLFHPSTDVYTCPLAMTDGAARTLLASGNQALIERAVPHLTSRDPHKFWTSGQWMTESTGGSDVGRSETMARLQGEQWRLYGRKWFTSAATSQMSLALARPHGNPEGGKGLALFYVEMLRDENGRLPHITLNRLKDKLGTRKLPTAELMLEGTPAIPVLGTANGVRHMVPMLHLTRTWNSICATAVMRRGLALARSYAQKRVAFGATLAEKPLHNQTLAWLQSEFEAAFHLTFYLVELIGKDEHNALSDDEHHLLRLLTSVTKLTTGRQAVAVSSEILEAHGGAGYVEDTGLPMLLRDAQVLSIWEGTTNVLALDTLRAITADKQVMLAWQTLITEQMASVQDGRLQGVREKVETAVAHTLHWLRQPKDRATLEAGARGLALTIGRTTALALLANHAQHLLDKQEELRPLLAARCFAHTRIDQLVDSVDVAELALLANDQSLA